MSSRLVLGTVVLAYAASAFAAPAAGIRPPIVDDSGPRQSWTTLPTQSLTSPAEGQAACLTPPAGMACVPGGPAILGDDDDKAARPKRVVTLSTFYIDTTEVSRADYQRCVDAKGCKALLPIKADVATDLPVQLAWKDANSYCGWAGKRLPTEFEWEKAARGPNGVLHPWGNDAPTCERASSRGCAKAPSAVSGLPAYAYGLKGMAGNVAEWTGTWHTPSAGLCGPRCGGIDPLGPCDGANPCPGQGPMRVVKGGSYLSAASDVAASARPGAVAATGRHGMRCATSTTTLTTWPPRQVSKPRAQPPLPTPPTAAQLARFGRIDEDELQKQICEKKGRSFVDCRDPNHYIRSNEPRQHLWRPFIENLGGGYAGVGIDQNYSFVAHARSEWVWLFDYDPTVVRLHHVLRAVIIDSPTRDEFLAHFEPRSKDAVLDLLSESYQGQAEAEAASYREIYTVASASLYVYYKNQMQSRVSIPDLVKSPTSAPDAPLRKAAVTVGDNAEDPTYGWLATDEAYNYIRLLYQQGRVHIMKGDMLAKKTMQGIGAAARDMGVTVRIYYPSNAPECWPHTAQYKANVRALPFDADSVVIQSLSGIKSGFEKQRGYWHHNVQSGLEQQALLGRRGYGSLKQLIANRRPGNDADLTVCGLPGGG
jgi:formylglycine-generating enzyme required for sulfatase activity